MRENVVLIEKSFADAIAMIAAAEELPEEKRRHWATSLRQVAKALDRPLEVIPARYSAVRADLINLLAEWRTAYSLVCEAEPRAKSPSAVRSPNVSSNSRA